MTFSEKLVMYKKEAGLNQEKIAKAIGIKRGTYAYYETGKTKPKYEVLQKLAKLYNVSVDDLLDDVDYVSVAQNEPDFESGMTATEKFNELSEYEKAVIMKVRLMSADEKKKLLDFINTI